VFVVPWDRLLNTGGSVAQLRPAIATFAAIVLVSIPAGIGQRIHLAYQQGWAAAAANGLGSVVSILAVAAAAVAHAGLPWFVAAMLGGNALAFAAETAWVFLRSHRDLRPRRSEIDGEILRRVFRTGGLFFVLAIAGAAAYQSDSLVISNHLGAAAVTRYAVALRLFTLAPTALAAIVMPLWPAYGEAIARHDVEWVGRTLHRSTMATLAASVTASLALLLAAGPFHERWSSGVADPPRGLLFALAVWAVVSAVSTTLAAYFNGANIIRFQVVVALTMAATNLALSLVLVRHLGVAGPVWASVITQSLVVLVPELVIVRRVVNRARLPAPATVSA
jgi:O-antigen/teichoic acid export membrane protein